VQLALTAPWEGDRDGVLGGFALARYRGAGTPDRSEVGVLPRGDRVGQRAVVECGVEQGGEVAGQRPGRRA
jgi:hypothetical protein